MLHDMQMSQLMNPLPLHEPRKHKETEEKFPNLSLLDVALLRDVHTIKELSDILVPHPADLLDVCGGLGDSLERVAEQNQLILLCLGDLDIDSGLHDDFANELLADEVTDLDLVDTVGVLVQVDVDGEMGVDVSHLVLEALGNTDDQVVDEGADGSESGNGLADAMVDVDGDDVLLWRGEGDGDVREVLDQLAPRALNSDLSCLDLDLDCWWRQDLVSIWCKPCVVLYVCSK